QGFQAAILERGAIVGGIGFRRIDWEQRATTIGYWMPRTSRDEARSRARLRVS
ncbi:MAG: hypothetical protein JO153_10375, partial [Solirubrobacterales bacterium]|nr:hypothetical protein [Solirubrobacterales bacterium]